MITKLLLLIFLIFLSGAFSAAEIALISLSQAKVRAISKDSKFGSKPIVRLKSRPQRLLITILIGNNLVNILATVIATIWAVEAFGGTGVGIVTGLLTFIILVFGEITPKTLAQKYSEKAARLLAYPLLWLTEILYPVIWIFEKFTQALISKLKIKQPLHSVSQDELLALVDIGTKEGVIQEQEQELIENVLEFSDTTVEEVMTVKKNMELLKIESTVDDAVHFFLTHAHTRFPIYKSTINNIVGILTVHEILMFLYDPQKKPNLSDFKLNPPIVVPKTKPINKLFHEFQRKGQHMAIVVDERGDTAGLVTLEDILEEIVGDIADEHDLQERNIWPTGVNEFEANGDTTIEELNKALDVKLDFPAHQTISLLILEKLRRFPKSEEKIVFENLIFQIKQMSPKKIETVTITKLPAPAESGEKN